MGRDWWIVPRLNTKIFSLILRDFARHFGLNQEHRVVLALDQASFHLSEKLEVLDGIDLIFMPPKSPELQPAERLWPLTNEPIANRTFASIDELEDNLFKRCRHLLQEKKLIQGLTNYY